MKNKQLIITLGVVSAIAIASYIVYTMMKGSTVVAKKTTVTTAKQVAAAAATAKANPNDAAAQAAYLNLGKSLVTALMATNSAAKPSTSPTTGAATTTVDSSGNYIENSDPTTLYNADGSVKGNLDTSTGMFVNSQGQIVANSDGTPASVNQYGNIVEADGSVYALDGTPIQQNSDGTYNELNPDGSVGQAYTNDGNPIDTTASNTPAYDPYADPDADPNMAASGYRSSFGKKTIHSLLRK
jgi:hypothetical protein